MDRGAWQATGGRDRVGHDGETPRQQREERPVTQRGRRAAENWTEHDFFLAGRRWRRGPQGGFLLNSLARTLALGHSLLFHLLINKSLSQPVCVHWGRVCVG